ncbi:MAG: MurR/RpiR family transcriptional regulator, partial [Sneathiella sp.]|nr:MurR/RpiR family transcriptional regulator [Sneathiella sp.]
RNITKTMQLLDTSAVEEFAQSVKQSKRTFILGTGSSMHWMAGMMASIGEMALPGIRSNLIGLPTSLETIASINSEDTLLVMSTSPYAKNSIDAAAFAKEQNAMVYAVTDKRSSPLVEHASRVFFAPTESPHYYPSIVSTVLMIEILLSAAVAASETLDRIKQAEYVQNKSGAYL